MPSRPADPGFLDLFTPKLITVLRERYALADLRADALAGLTVAIVALPLSMAIAIASGVAPERGLYSAIIGGFLVSALGGSRFQIGGPAGAFIVLVATTVEIHGLDGLLLATMMSGVFLASMGILRLGTYIKYIPYPVTVGFTAGIGLIILASQLRDLLGLHLTAREPAAFLPKLEALGAALPGINPAAVVLGGATVALILLLRRWRPRWPGFLIAVIASGVAASLLALPVETIGSRFGGIPQALPLPQLPALSWPRIVELLPTALSFTLLGAIESLLSAVVADSMSGRRHRSNCELVAQGVANIAAALFGGICVTGTIARTATNVRAGARGPIAGMLHSLFLLGFIVVAAPLAAAIPLATLAGILVVVAWNMIERHAMAALLRTSRGDALVLLATLALTVLMDLSAGILAGFTLGSLLFLHRMAQAVEVETEIPLVEEDRADRSAPRLPYDAEQASAPDVVVHHISGAFFFGAAASVGTVLDRLGDTPGTHVLDFSRVPVLDSTAAATIEGFLRKAERQQARVFIAGARAPVRHVLLANGVRPPRVRYRSDLAGAIASARQGVSPDEPPN